tara:strand:+ start:1993 stop:2262 length:270 start_codon:yes stop_codon:yes gene_type:complete
MEKVENKISEDELKMIQDQQGQLTECISRIGVLETQKHHLLHEIGAINEKVEEAKKELEAKYGQVNINIEDGSYEEIKEEEKVEEVEHV